MTESTKHYGQGKSVRKIGKKLFLLLGATIAALFAFSCSQDASNDVPEVQKTFNIEYVMDGGTNPADNPKSYSIDKLPVELKEPSKDGFTFDGWYTDKDFKTKIVKIEKGTTGKLTLRAKWTKVPTANYKVIHLLQPVTGDTYAQNEEQTLSGKVGGDTKAEAKNYPNFHVSETKHPDKKITQTVIKKDGSTKIEIYYDRDTFTATFDTDGGNEIASVSGRFKAPLDAGTVPAPTKENFTFEKWEPALPATFVANTTHKAKWIAEVLPQYKVEHWLQKVDPSTGKVLDAGTHNDTNYELKNLDTQTKTGKKNTQTQASAKSYTGFETPSVTQENINEDGSTVVKIYYVRKGVTLTFDAKGGKIDGEDKKTLSGKYGEKIEASDVPSPASVNADEFSGWTPAKPENFPEENKTYEAQWKRLLSIEITSEPTTKDYIVGENFNHAGLVVKAKYSDDSNPPLKYNVDYETDFDNIKNSIGDNQTVTVKHKKDPSKTVTFKVNIKQVPAITYEFGDIIDGTDGKKYKPDSFTPTGSGPNNWEKYYVIIKVEGTKYVGARYFDNTGYGDVELGSSIANTYQRQPNSSNRYLTKDDAAAIFAQKDKFKSSIKKIKPSGIPNDLNKENCIYKGKNFYDEDAFFNGNDEEITSSSWKNRDILPIVARDFN